MRMFVHLNAYGDHYTGCALRYVIPSCLAEGNLPAMKKAGYEITYLIFTRQADIQTFESHPAMEKLKKFADIEYIPIDSLISDERLNKFKVLCVTYNKTLQRAYDNNTETGEDSACFFTHADGIYSDSYLAEYLKYRPGIFVHFAIWVDGHAFEKYMDERYNAESMAMSMDAETMARLGIKHISDIVETYLTDTEHANAYSAGIISVRGQAMAGRYFYLHPSIITVRKTTPRLLIEEHMNPDTSIALFDDPDFCRDCHIVTDSGRAAVVALEYSVRGEKVDYKNRYNTLIMSRLIGKSFFRYHIEFAKHTIIHGETDKRCADDVSLFMDTVLFWHGNGVDITEMLFDLNTMDTHTELISGKYRPLLTKICGLTKSNPKFFSWSQSAFASRFMEKLNGDKADVFDIIDLIDTAGGGETYLRRQYDDLKKCLKQLKNRDNIILYGMGKNGRYLLAELDNVAMICDDNTKGELGGKTIMNCSQVFSNMTRDREYTFIFCSSNLNLIDSMDANVKRHMEENRALRVEIIPGLFKEFNFW